MTGEFNLSELLKLKIYSVAVVLAGCSLPLFLIIITHYTGFSEVIEELSKALIVYFFIIKFSKLSWQIVTALVFGFLFGLSESIFYLNNIFQIGNLNIFWERFLLSIPLHVITVLIILFSAQKNKKFIIFGVVTAIVLHLIFNKAVLSMF
jgi:RsiW-degrading membrane proteinase PrsW (M82 family)